MISPELESALRKERSRMLKEIEAINVVLGEDPPVKEVEPPEVEETQSPPFPYRTEPLAPPPPQQKVRLTQEFGVFCNGRRGKVITVRNFQAYLSTNFPEGSYNENSARGIVHQAFKEGKLTLVTQGSRGNQNPTMYQVKETA